MRDLNLLIRPDDPLFGVVHLTHALDINDLGYILAAGHTGDGITRSYLLGPVAPTPVPEPTSLVLLGVGLLLTARYRRRDRRGPALRAAARQ